MKKFALIVAAGSGTRMGTDVPKQFLEIEGKPLIFYSASSFISAYPEIQLILVFPESHLEKGKELFIDFQCQHPVIFTTGGVTRFHSVQNGLKQVEPSSVVFVHDAVRCLVSAHLIKRCFEQAMLKGSAIPVITVKDSVRRVEADGSSVALNREMLRSVQTPQTFLSDLLLPAFQQEYQPVFTDEATVMELNGQKIHLTEGEETNIKITYPMDLVVAEKTLQVAEKVDSLKS